MKMVITAMLTTTALTMMSHGVTQDLPDPTRPAEYQTTVIARDLPKALADWNVTAIRISASDRTAIVNGRIVRVGDAIGQATVLDIQPVQIILKYENRQVAVRLFSDGVIRKQSRNSLRGD
jgi:hypothetical protein